jgi:hypothetical protein
VAETQLLYVVMGGEIVIAAYRRADLASRHSRCLTGTSVVELDVSLIRPELLALIEGEVLHELPESIVEDLNAEGWDEDVTPEVESGLEAEMISVHEIADLDDPKAKL